MNADAIAREYSEKLRSALGSRVRDIILFGSRARGDNEYYSDYDMLIVVDRRDRAIVKKIRKIAVEMLDHHDACSVTSCMMPMSGRGKKGFHWE